MKQVVINEAASQKLKGRFPWVYNNEILRLPKNISEGEIVEVRSPSGLWLGIGYVNTRSVISIRIFSFEDEPIDKNFFMEKVLKAERLRAGLKKSTNAYRVVHAEADELPGLVVDSYDGYLSIQINTAGMEMHREIIKSTLQDCLNPWGIYEKSDSKAREKEGLTTHDSVLSGVIPERIRIEDAGASFFVGFQESQKTGFYLDQRRNRTIVAGYVEPGSRVLDVFSNTGGFGIHAALKGAESVRLVDISQKALQTARDNADLNGLRGIETVKADAFDYMTSQENAGSEYSMIVLDPPSFTGTSHSRRGAIRGFKRLVSGALGLLKPEGLLAVFSCSHHISMEDLNNIAKEASGNAGLRLRVAEQLFQDLDHPYIVNIPQSLYLKGILLQKV